MGFFDFFKSKKVDDKTKLAFNYYLFFEHIPKALSAWWNIQTPFNNAISFEGIASEKPEFAFLCKKVETVSSGLNRYPDITLYLITPPAVEFPGAVASAIIGVNQKTRRYMYYTMENSFGGYAICEACDDGNHANTGVMVQDGEQFGAYCIKQAIDILTGPGFSSNPNNRPLNAR